MAKRLFTLEEDIEHLFAAWRGATIKELAEYENCSEGAMSNSTARAWDELRRVDPCRPARVYHLPCLFPPTNHQLRYHERWALCNLMRDVEKTIAWWEELIAGTHDPDTWDAYIASIN